MGKTVYIFGAGASQQAGLPGQRDLLSQAIDPRRTQSLSLSQASQLNQRRRRIRAFIERVFRANAASTSRVSLEDILTTLDRAIASKETVRGYSQRALLQLREDLVDTMLYVFEVGLANSRLDVTMQCGLGLVLKRLEAGQRADPFSIISTNWDLTLDFSLEATAGLLNASLHESAGGKDHKGVRIDYCTYTYPVSESAHHPPCIHLKSLGYHNVKLIKPHGSINWLVCPSCGRLYLRNQGKTQETILNIPKPGSRYYCRLCPAPRVRLQPLMITPTFLKDLTHTHVRMVWQNAMIELTQADRIVFVGYSFPQADFDFRYMLAKAMRPDTRVEVFLRQKGQSLSDQERAEKNRYLTFFGRENSSISFGRFEGFVEREFPSERLLKRFSKATRGP